MKTTSYLVDALSGPLVHEGASLTGVIAARMILLDGVGLRLTRERIVARVKSMLPRGGWVIVAGVEPMRFVDRELCVDLRLAGFSVNVETNGGELDPTVRFEARLVDDRPDLTAETRVDLITLRPTMPVDEVKLERCDDLVVRWPPLPGVDPERFDAYPARRRFLETDLDDEDARAATVQKLIDLNRSGPHRWRMSTRSA